MSITVVLRLLELGIEAQLLIELSFDSFDDTCLFVNIKITHELLCKYLCKYLDFDVSIVEPVFMCKGQF